MSESNQNIMKTFAKIAVAVGSYWAVSISMVFLNSYLLSGSERMEAPIFITWYQCFVAVVVLSAASRMSSHSETDKDAFPELTFDPKIARQVLPLSIVFASMIGFNNLCLKFVGVAFYTVARSLSTVFNVALTYFVLGETTSGAAMLCCGVLASGFMLGVQQEGTAGSLSFVGVLFGVLASLFVSLNSTYVKKVLPVVNNNSWRLTYYNNVLCCFLFLPMMLISGEFSIIVSFPLITSGSFWFMMTMGGLLGIAIAIVTANQIKFTSPLTHLVSGTAKAATQTVVAIAVGDQAKSGLWWFSNALVLGGSAAYAQVRRREMVARMTDDAANSDQK